MYYNAGEILAPKKGTPTKIPSLEQKQKNEQKTLRDFILVSLWWIVTANWQLEKNAIGSCLKTDHPKDNGMWPDYKYTLKLVNT